MPDSSTELGALDSEVLAELVDHARFLAQSHADTSSSAQVRAGMLLGASGVTASLVAATVADHTAAGAATWQRAAIAMSLAFFFAAACSSIFTIVGRRTLLVHHEQLTSLWKAYKDDREGSVAKFRTLAVGGLVTPVDVPQSRWAAWRGKPIESKSVLACMYDDATRRVLWLDRAASAFLSGLLLLGIALVPLVVRT